RPHAGRAGGELDAVDSSSLRRTRSVSRWRMQRRIPFAAALFGRLALRQQPARSRPRSDSRSGREQRAPFRSRNDLRLAALSLPGCKSRVAAAPWPDGGAREGAAPVRNSHNPTRLLASAVAPLARPRERLTS